MNSYWLPVGERGKREYSIAVYSCLRRTLSNRTVVQNREKHRLFFVFPANFAARAAAYFPIIRKVGVSQLARNVEISPLWGLSSGFVIKCDACALQERNSTVIAWPVGFASEAEIDTDRSGLRPVWRRAKETVSFPLSLVDSLLTHYNRATIHT